MKKKFLSIFVLLLFVALSFYLSAPSYAESNLKCLSVIGNATVEIAPDSAKVSAVIEKLDVDSVKSKDDNLDKLNAVTEELANLGVTDVNVDSFSSYACYDYDNGRNLKGYSTNCYISFTVNDLGKIASYLDSILQNGATSIRSITYTSSNFNSAYNEAMTKAVENAMEKCETLGGKNLNVISIKEDYSYSSNYLYRSFCDGADNLNNFENQKIEVNAKVIVEFA